MFNWMRTHQRKLWLVITILTIVAFGVLYNRTPLENLGSNDFLQIYGKGVTKDQFERAARKYNLALALGLSQYANALGGNGGQEAYVDFALNSMIIDHQGAQLGIRPTNDEIKDAIAGLAVFQTNGQFDPIKYGKLSETALTPQGFSDIDLQSLVRSSIIFDRIKRMIDSAPAVTDTDLANVRRALQPVTGFAVTFNNDDFTKTVKISDLQIADYFKANSSAFVTPEWRTVKFVRFLLPNGSDKLQGKAKIDAQQKIADASDAFATRAASVGLEKAAAESNLKVDATLPFDRNGQIQGLAELMANVSADPVQAVAPTAFTLTKEAPVSGVIENGNGFVVVELGNVNPSHPMTLEEAKSKIVEQLTATAAAAALKNAANDAIAKLRAAAKAGQPVDQAAAAAGLHTEAFTNVSVADEKATEQQRMYADAVSYLQDGEVSGLRPSETGGYIVWLQSRGQLDEKKFAGQRDMIVKGMLGRAQSVLWQDWIESARKTADIRSASRG
jgi:peptidyl-prolyl cis-trans isomerase D